MDTQKLITEAKARFKHHENKIYLQEKYGNSLTIVSQGGMWTITPEFLGFLASSPETVILKDNYGNPIRVETKKLYSEAVQIYNTTMEAWLQEYNNLKNLR